MFIGPPATATLNALPTLCDAGQVLRNYLSHVIFLQGVKKIKKRKKGKQGASPRGVPLLFSSSSAMEAAHQFTRFPVIAVRLPLPVPSPQDATQEIYGQLLWCSANLVLRNRLTGSLV